MGEEERLRRAFAAARRAAANGTPPFGSVLVDAAGGIVLEAENDMITTGDVTGHAEINLIREASRKLGPALGGYTLYTSCEPCAMCSVACYWSGLERIVFGLSHPRLVEIRGEGGPPMMNLRCHEVAERGVRGMAVTGPMLEDEAAALFG
ncbi:MAG: nucleoside deaminase [Defluviicoccus sp.]|nr:nucleoside deaminase [Defluviicoccus sp.]